MRRLAFWASGATLAVAHLLFPLAMLARGRLRRRPFRSAPVTPSVSVIVAAHDEAANIGGRIANVLALDYPADRLELVLASDGSTDATVAIAARSGDPRVRVLDLPRVGKAAALDAAIAAASGEVLAFSDANSEWAPDALRALVAPFADPSVGGVAGDQRYRSAGGGPSHAVAASGERAYWALDRRIKSAESQGGDAISATGAIYAVRRALVGPVAPGVTDDFYISTGVIAAGRRLVFAPDAVAWEPVARSANGEWSRKVRIITRGLRGVVVRRDLLDPRRHGAYSVQLLGHKVLRRLAVYPLIVAGLSSLALAREGRIYALAAGVQGAAWGAGLLGLAVGDRPLPGRRLLAAPAYVVLVSAASLVASVNVLRGRTIASWDPDRRPPESPGRPAAAGDRDSAERLAIGATGAPPTAGALAAAGASPGATVPDRADSPRMAPVASIEVAG